MFDRWFGSFWMIVKFPVGVNPAFFPEEMGVSMASWVPAYTYALCLDRETRTEALSGVICPRTLLFTTGGGCLAISCCGGVIFACRSCAKTELVATHKKLTTTKFPARNILDKWFICAE